MIHAQALQKVFLDKKRGTLQAVADVSFSVASGEIFGLLGPNGAGKTTTLRMLATILKPTAGTATVSGFDIVKSPAEVRRHIGFLSGDMGQYGRLTPREVLTFFAKLNHLSAAQSQRRFSELVERFHFGSYVDTKIDKLSTGMRQKIAIARAVIHDPPVLILDEPSSGLDVPAARQIEAFIQSGKRAGKCILFSTHVMEEAEYLCDRLAVVNEGRITAIGTMQELRGLTGKERLRDVFVSLLGLTEALESEVRA
jgi:sodium transport system ATP-binding protein